MEDYLIHHGIKGMKWGVRKQRSTSGRSTTNTKKRKQLNIDKKKVAQIAITSGAIAAAAGIGYAYAKKRYTTSFSDAMSTIQRTTRDYNYYVGKLMNNPLPKGTLSEAVGPFYARTDWGTITLPRVEKSL